jgi:hypothetical protein
VDAHLKSNFWIQATLRRCQAQGNYGAVIHKGADEAGTVFVVINHLNGEYTLLSPPPGPAHDEQGERRFVVEPGLGRSWNDVAGYIARKRKFDSDLWLVEIEDRSGLAGLRPESH